MSVEILTQTPTSGEFPEFYFGEHFRQSLWVEFVDNNYDKWVGCFECDYPKGLNKVLIDNENRTAFIVSGGVGYLIDIERKELKYKTEEHPLIESAIVTTKPDYFLAGNFYCIYVFDNEKLIKEVTADDLVDGIYLKRQVDSRAIGELASIENQYEFNLDFQLDLETLEIIVDRSKLRNQESKKRDTESRKTENLKITAILKRLINKIKKANR